MLLSVKEIITDKELKKFIHFSNRLYRGDPNYVIPITDFEFSSLSKKKNPALEYCEAKYWLIYRDNEIVGRVAGIIHGMEIKDKSIARFGWIDFIDDERVFDLLIKTVSDWAKSKGLENIHGPMGFTDLDFEGSLIKGFDQLATQATIYNYPYYQKHFERTGFEKACDWIEVRGSVPGELPRRLTRTASIVQSRFKLKILKVKKAKDLLPYGQGVFEVLNEAYDGLYGYYPLTQKQIDYYIDLYFGFIRKEFVTIILDKENTVVGFAISLPSLSKAFQKAKGSLFPFGFIHVLKAFYNNKHVDMFLIGVSPKYQKLGVNVLIFHEMIKTYIEKGVEYVSSGPMLEDNRGVLNLWNEYREHLDAGIIRRRCYIKSI